MSLGLNKTKRRITSVNSTKKITKAMELIATVKLKKFKNVMLDNSLYSEEIFAIAQEIFHNSTKISSIYTSENEADKDLYVVINSNLGLCASYNNNVFHLVDKTVKKTDKLIVIGSRGLTHYTNEGFDLEEEHQFFSNGINYKGIQELISFVLNEYVSKKYAHVNLIYTHYVNSLKFEPMVFQIFPVPIIKTKDDYKEYPPLFEPNIQTVVDEIIPLYLTTILYQKIIESMVSEQASRRTAMENANDNADDLLEKLTLEYNKARQSAITQEITEVTSGSSANS